MRLLATSDLHVNKPGRLEQIDNIAHHKDCALIIAGDICEDINLIEIALKMLSDRFDRIVFAPGNHDIWVEPRAEWTSADKYRELISICRRLGIHTPEDQPLAIETGEGAVLIVPLFALYDHGWSPTPGDEVANRARADKLGYTCLDEIFVRTDPGRSVREWSHALVSRAERRLACLEHATSKILVSHFPLVRPDVLPGRMEVFLPWCGSPRTEHWPAFKGVRAVISGHLHRQSIAVRDGVTHYEVSFGTTESSAHAFCEIAL